MCIVLIMISTSSEKIYTTIYDDFSPAFHYNGFTPYPNNGFQGYYNDTNHLTYNLSASVSFS